MSNPPKVPLKPTKPIKPKRSRTKPIHELIYLYDGDSLQDVLDKAAAFGPCKPSDLKYEQGYSDSYGSDSSRFVFENNETIELSDAKWEEVSKKYEAKVVQYEKDVKEYNAAMVVFTNWANEQTKKAELAQLKTLLDKYGQQ